MRALLIPADPARPVSVVEVADTAAAFSRALGDVLFDSVAGVHAGHRYAIYLPDDNTARPDNLRAAVLVARLGMRGGIRTLQLRGDILLTGLHPSYDDDCDVPTAVVDAAYDVGFMRGQRGT